MVRYAANTGNPFQFFRDLGSHRTPEGATNAFMEYHGVSVADICDVLRWKPVEFEKRRSKPNFKSQKVAAAVGIITEERGQYASWPEDAIRALLGEKYHGLEDAA